MELKEDFKVRPAPRATERTGEVGVRFTQHADKYNAGETALLLTRRRRAICRDARRRRIS